MAASLAVFLTALPPYRLTAQAYFQQSVRYELGAYLDEASGVLTAGGRLTYRNNSPDTLHEIDFHLYLNAFRPGSLWSADEVREGIHRFADLPDPYHAYERLGQVTISGTSVTPTYPNAPDSTIARFDLPGPLRPGDSLVVLLQWTARPSAIPRRQGRQGRRFDFAQWYPKVCVYDRGGWQAHPLHLAGELYGEYGTYDVTLDLAQDQVVAASGVPVDGDPGWAGARARPGTPVNLQADWYGSRLPASVVRVGAASSGRKRVRFYAENIHHFAWSTNPEYRYEEGRFGDVVLRTLYLPQDSATWGGGRVIERTRRAMAWLDTIFGTYAYPQTIVVHRIEGGGTEFPMMVMNGGPEESLIFHEVGHIYTYGILGNNEWKEGFLDEGFTTFQTAWNFQRRGMGVPSTQTQQLILNMDLDAWSEPVSKVSEDFSEFGIYNRMVYTKGQLFYEMLRYVVGEPVFRRGLRLYYDRWKLKHVDEDALRLAMEEVSGKDLRGLFFEWLHQTPLVDYGVRRVNRWVEDSGNWRTEIIVERRGGGAMPVDIAVPHGDSIITLRVPGIQSRDTIDVVTPSRTGRVELDPGRQTMDWNYLNNREPAGPLGFLGAVGPKSVNRIGWSGSQPARRDRRVNNWLPLAWYNEAGGVQAGLQWRSNYLGRFDQNAVQLTAATRDTAGSQRIGLWVKIRNPRWARAPRQRYGADLFYVEGRRGGKLWATFDRSRHLTYGPRRTLAFEISHLDLTSPAYVDSALWSDVSATEAAGSFAVRWTGQGTASDVRISTGAGLAGEPHTFGLRSVRVYARGSVDLRHRRTAGNFEVRGRFYAAGSVGPDSLGIPSQRAVGLAGADPYETFANPFLRSRGALLVKPGVNYSAPGGAGLRAFQPDLRATWVAAVNGELVRPLFLRPRRRVFSSLSVAAFGDAALVGSPRILAGGLDQLVFADAGLGVRASHRIGPTSFVTRVDVPLAATRVRYPQRIGVGAPTGADASGRLRFVWSFEEAF